MSLAAQLRLLADQVALLEIAIQPPPPPPPVVVDPPAPPPNSKPARIERLLDKERFVCFRGWNDGQLYRRWQDLIVLKGPTKLGIRTLTKGGAQRIPFSGLLYTLTCDGVPVTTIQTKEGVDYFEFSFDASTLTEGWHIFDITGGETAAFYPMYVLHGERALPQQWMPVCTSTFDLQVAGPLCIDWVPAVSIPTTVALPKRDSYPHFSDVKPRQQMWRDEIVPRRSGDIRRTNINKDGILNTFNRQWYTWGDFTVKTPYLPLLDGPRGVGNMAYVSHVEIGTFVNPITKVPGNMLYVLDPWRVTRIKPNGQVTTLAGWRHKNIPSHWNGPQELELVGDWSAIPAERHGFHELWGMCWDVSSLHTDTNALPVPQENNLQPHLGYGPAMLVSDSQNNRICKITFGGASSSQGLDARHDIPPKVTEFLTGLNDPWDVVAYKDSFIVSERGSHRICQYNQDGSMRRIITQGEPLSIVVKQGRFVQRLATIEAIRAQDCVGPEGLYVIDDWLYFASEAMQQVRRIHLVDGQIEVVVPDYTGGAGQYLKIAVSDGTFGPKHTVFITGWTKTHFGGPAVALPDGKGFWTVVFGSGSSVSRGLGGNWDSMGYNAAVACKDGRLVYGSSEEGLAILSSGLPNDVGVDNVLYTTGKREWTTQGLRMFYGENGFGFQGLPLPWGKSEAIDYYLTWNGHTKPIN